MVVPHENWSPEKILELKTSIFWSENSDSAVFEGPRRGNEKEFYEN